MEPLDDTFMPDAIAAVAIPGVRILPTVHERLDLAPVVRGVLEAVQPAVVAVELPTTLEEAVERALGRLPEISVILSEEGGEAPLVWAVAPGDPLVEALRWAEENGRRWVLIDPDVRYIERHQDPIPDPYALWQLGPAQYLELLQRGFGQEAARAGDLQREAGMAYHLQRASAALPAADAAQGVTSEIVAVVGAAHAKRLAQRLKSPAAIPLARSRRSRVTVRNLDPESLCALLPDPPVAHAAYELLRRGEVPSRPASVATISRKVSVLTHGLRLIVGDRDDELLRRRRAIPRLAAHHAYRELLPGVLGVDRGRLGGAVWKLAGDSFGVQTQETLTGWQRKIFFDYARRFARVQGQLVPGTFGWVVAARGVADDNLAWEVFDVARTYPWQQALSDLETVRIDGDELDLGTRKVHFRRRFFRTKQRPVRIPVRTRPEAEDPAEWLEGFDSEGICSYPKEDLVIEDYAVFLQKKAVALLSTENRRTEPFSSSLLDGIDLKETLRNLHEGKIYVQELGRSPGSAGSVVVIFDEDPSGEGYPYCMTWHGEHDQESDMAFYATNPFEQVVGPGITRATYGAFMMTFPPRRVFDVWQDPDYRGARDKGEVLVLAAIDYSEEKLVVHVAAQAPAQRLQRYASYQHKRLVHIPLGALSPMTLKKIRVVHLLAGYDKRAVANRYIW